MDCTLALSLLDAWLDGELHDARAHGVERHLADCDDCRAAAAAWRANDAALRVIHRGDAEAADRVADRVLAALGDDVVDAASVPPDPRGAVRPTETDAGSVGHDRRGAVVGVGNDRRSRRGRWASFAAVSLAAAAGFLVAVLVFQPWRERVEFVEVPRPELPRVDGDAPRLVPAVAHFTTATGPVEFRPPESDDWRPLADLATFECPANTGVRTGPNVKAELRTSDGSVLRLDDSTSLVLRSANEVEMQSGQLWCRTPDDQPLKVVASPAPADGSPMVPTIPESAGPWSMVCPPSTACSASSQAGKVTITSSDGEVDVLVKGDRRTVGSGETVEIEGGTVIPQHAFDADPLLSTRWIHPLLVRRGHGNAELRERVDAMLARVGATKLSNLYEAEIRSLGEYAVLPLLRFVQSEESTADEWQLDRRARAMRIVADLAPSWAVGDLIDLLADADPATRVQAATALARLTDAGFGLAPAAWATAGDAERAEALVSWQAWWAENRERYPSLAVE